MVEFDPSTVFGDVQLATLWRYEDHQLELCKTVWRIEAHEATTRQLVMGFEAYQPATGDDEEARFVRWEICREKADRRLHKSRAGIYENDVGPGAGTTCTGRHSPPAPDR